MLTLQFTLGECPSGVPFRVITAYNIVTLRATFRVFKIERKMYGVEDVKFLERVFQKLMLNFTYVLSLSSRLVPCSERSFLTQLVGQSQRFGWSQRL